jgi:two-component system chemotaxis response regulator CheV
MLDFEHILQEVNPSSRKRMKAGQDKVLSVIERLGDASRLRVLVAEDSSLMAEMIKGALEEGGFKRLESVPDGSQAMERLLVAEEEGHPFDLLVSDVEMPVMDGLKLLRMVKSEPRLSSMPVVMFSSIMTESIRNRAREAGSQAEISKPDIDTLLETVCGLLAE